MTHPRYYVIMNVFKTGLVCASIYFLASRADDNDNSANLSHLYLSLVRGCNGVTGDGFLFVAWVIVVGSGSRTPSAMGQPAAAPRSPIIVFVFIHGLNHVGSDSTGLFFEVHTGHSWASSPRASGTPAGASLHHLRLLALFLLPSVLEPDLDLVLGDVGDRAQPAFPLTVDVLVEPEVALELGHLRAVVN